MEYPLTTATVETLPNGLTLILDPDPSAPVVSAQIWVATGSVHEDELLGSGLSHFLEHMVFKGTRGYDSQALADTVQAAGGHWNAYTSFDRTVYYIDGPSDSLPVFLNVLTDLVFFPLIPESEFEKEKDVIRREIDMGLDDPDNVSTQLLLSTAFTADPRRHPVIGHRHLFGAIQYGDLTAYHRRRYTPDRCTAVISGDFDPDEIRETLAALTRECLPGCGREPLVAKDPKQLGPRRGRAVFQIPVSRISLAWKSPALDHPDAPAFDVLAAILGRGRASILHRKLREEKELALEISAFSWTGPGREGLLAISAETGPDKRDALIDAIHAELSAIAASPLDDQLAKAKRQIAASQFRSLTTASGRASDLGSNWHEARDPDFTRRYLAAIQAVTPADILGAAATLTEERSTLSILDPLEAPAPARGAKSKPKSAEIETHTLPNGLRIALLPDRRVPLVHLQAAVLAGLPSEIPENNGLNQLLASTLPEGTTRRGSHELAMTLESLGASASARTGNNALLVQAAGLAPDFETISGVFSEIILTPSFPEDSLAREKASQLASLEEALQDPIHSCFSNLRKQIFDGTGYGLDPLGSLDSLPSLDRLSLSAHHARHFNAANMTIAIAGDFEPSAVLDSLSGKFSGLPYGSPWQAPRGPLRMGGDGALRLPKMQAVIAIGYPGETANSPRRHALAMIQEYASDMAGPLFTRLREELGLAYRVGATQFLGLDAGLFTFYIATSPEQAELARTELLAEIGKIAANGIPDDTFDRVRSTVLSGLAIQQQSPSATARHIALDLLFGHPADEHRRLRDIYHALRPGDVRAVAAEIFHHPPTFFTVLPK